MAQIQEHAAAGATADAPIPRQQNRRAPQHARANDELLTAVRRKLVPDDPIALLLARQRAADTTS